MSNEEDNKAIVGRWFKEFWGENGNPDIVDELARKVAGQADRRLDRRRG